MWLSLTWALVLTWRALPAFALQSLVQTAEERSGQRRWLVSIACWHQVELEIDTAEGTPPDPAPAAARFRGPESAFAAAQEQAGEWKTDASPEAMDMAPQDKPEGSSPTGAAPQLSLAYCVLALGGSASPAGCKDCF